MGESGIGTGGGVDRDSVYARKLLSGRTVNEEEQTPARRLRRRVGWEELVGAAEQIRQSHGSGGRSGTGIGDGTE